MLARFRHIPPLAYLALACSLVGAVAELTYHFLPPATVPAYTQWLASLSAADRDFFGLVYELIAHVFIAVGLMGMVTILLHEQLRKSEAK